jgi:hypothetical protein
VETDSQPEAKEDHVALLSKRLDNAGIFPSRINRIRAQSTVWLKTRPETRDTPVRAPPTALKTASDGGEDEDLPILPEIEVRSKLNRQRKQRLDELTAKHEMTRKIIAHHLSVSREQLQALVPARKKPELPKTSHPINLGTGSHKHLSRRQLYHQSLSLRKSPPTSLQHTKQPAIHSHSQRKPASDPLLRCTIPLQGTGHGGGEGPVGDGAQSMSMRRSLAAGSSSTLLPEGTGMDPNFSEAYRHFLLGKQKSYDVMDESTWKLEYRRSSTAYHPLLHGGRKPHREGNEHLKMAQRQLNPYDDFFLQAKNIVRHSHSLNMKRSNRFSCLSYPTVPATFVASSQSSCCYIGGPRIVEEAKFSSKAQLHPSSIFSLTPAINWEDPTFEEFRNELGALMSHRRQSYNASSERKAKDLFSLLLLESYASDHYKLYPGILVVDAIGEESSGEKRHIWEPPRLDFLPKTAFLGPKLTWKQLARRALTFKSYLKRCGGNVYPPAQSTMLDELGIRLSSDTDKIVSKFTAIAAMEKFAPDKAWRCDMRIPPEGISKFLNLLEATKTSVSEAVTIACNMSQGAEDSNFLTFLREWDAVVQAMYLREKLIACDCAMIFELSDHIKLSKMGFNEESKKRKRHATLVKELDKLDDMLLIKLKELEEKGFLFCVCGKPYAQKIAFDRHHISRVPFTFCGEMLRPDVERLLEEVVHCPLLWGNTGSLDVMQVSMQKFLDDYGEVYGKGTTRAFKETSTILSAKEKAQQQRLQRAKLCDEAKNLHNLMSMGAEIDAMKEEVAAKAAESVRQKRRVSSDREVAAIVAERHSMGEKKQPESAKKVASSREKGGKPEPVKASPKPARKEPLQHANGSDNAVLTESLLRKVCANKTIKSTTSKSGKQTGIDDKRAAELALERSPYEEIPLQLAPQASPTTPEMELQEAMPIVNELGGKLLLDLPGTMDVVEQGWIEEPPAAHEDFLLEKMTENTAQASEQKIAESAVAELTQVAAKRREMLVQSRESNGSHSHQTPPSYTEAEELLFTPDLTQDSRSTVPSFSMMERERAQSGDNNSGTETDLQSPESQNALPTSQWMFAREMQESNYPQHFTDIRLSSASKDNLREDLRDACGDMLVPVISPELSEASADITSSLNFSFKRMEVLDEPELYVTVLDKELSATDAANAARELSRWKPAIFSDELLINGVGIEGVVEECAEKELSLSQHSWLTAKNLEDHFLHGPLTSRSEQISAPNQPLIQTLWRKYPEHGEVLKSSLHEQMQATSASSQTGSMAPTTPSRRLSSRKRKDGRMPHTNQTEEAFWPALVTTSPFDRSRRTMASGQLKEVPASSHRNTPEHDGNAPALEELAWLDATETDLLLGAVTPQTITRDAERDWVVRWISSYGTQQFY